ncbi:PRC-barrel domain-containing protein [Acuticoccus sp. MNP-M23]|uniref:PRC-barrel domain-containing protein n=1 Tax=Acuticoccus sp. MNP-M23 TaxID=3072793 RepID=UPI0028156B95|nr:PRC-barrel domain-containing protein [Acuticoccus sp. MNP-M23]WMS44248.1 PRC-barrel domain-containing protein [Acuticoccus sp. MNP-M23]
MTRNLLGGTALIAILSVTPAVAQDDMRVLMFADDAQMNARVAEMDTNGDGSVSMAEYDAYLVTIPVADADRATYVADFEALDANADGILVVTELEAGMATAAGGTAAQVDVTQAEAKVAVTQPAPNVNVKQGDATVAVSQPEPEVAVTQKEPEVSVKQAEPTVSVNQPEPEVSVQQDEATVSVDQPEAQVAIDAPAPEVEVRQATPDVQVTQKEPTVSVSQPEPDVSVQTAEADVSVQTEDANVVIEQGEPEVVIQKVTSVDTATTADADTELEEAADATGEAVQVAAAKTADAAGDATTAVMNAVAFDDIDGEDAYNNMNQEIGEISDIVMEKTSREIFVVVSAGGFLGIGDADVVFPYNSVSIAGDKVMIDTNMSEENLEDRNDYNEDLYEDVPEDMIVR